MRTHRPLQRCRGNGRSRRQTADDEGEQQPPDETQRMVPSDDWFLLLFGRRISNRPPSGVPELHLTKTIIDCRRWIWKSAKVIWTDPTIVTAVPFKLRNRPERNADYSS